MATIHISEADAARDFAGLLARVRLGEEIVIGATALHLGFDVATFNVKHFQHIPGLNIATL